MIAALANVPIFDYNALTLTLVGLVYERTFYGIKMFNI
jgi:hypothetical protein